MRLGQEALAGVTGVTSTGYCVAKVTFFSLYFGMAATFDGISGHDNSTAGGSQSPSECATMKSESYSSSICRF